MAVKELQSMVKPSPASCCPENCVCCVPGAFGEELLGMGEGGTDTRITGGGTWPPASLVQCCGTIKCCGSASSPEILDSPPSC